MITTDVLRCLKQLLEPAADFYLVHGQLMREADPVEGHESTEQANFRAQGASGAANVDAAIHAVTAAHQWIPPFLVEGITSFDQAGGFNAVLALVRSPGSLGLAGLVQLLSIVGNTREVLEEHFQARNQ